MRNMAKTPTPVKQRENKVISCRLYDSGNDTSRNQQAILHLVKLEPHFGALCSIIVQVWVNFSLAIAFQCNSSQFSSLFIAPSQARNRFSTPACPDPLYEITVQTRLGTFVGSCDAAGLPTQQPKSVYTSRSFGLLEKFPEEASGTPQLSTPHNSESSAVLFTEERHNYLTT